MRILIFLLSVVTIVGQPIDITFRYVERPSDDFLRLYIPGTFNNWGPNNNSIIDPSSDSQMNYNENTRSYEKKYTFYLGQEHEYKLHFHHNQSGSNHSWLTDPLNPLTTDDEWNNSVLNVSAPMFFQPARHQNDLGLVDGLSIGIFSLGTIDSVRYSVGEDAFSADGYISEDDVFYVGLDPARSFFESYKIQAFIDGQSYIAYDQSALEIVEQSIPQGVNMGPNWLDGIIYLAVYAPAQPVVQLIIFDGSTENGPPIDTLIMKSDPDIMDTWWIELDLENGVYDYQYLMLNGSKVPDPLSRIVVNQRTRIEVGPGGASTADDYNWQSVDYIRPQLDTLVIYELHIDDFAAQGDGNGTFQSVVDKLDYLSSLGINAIELMPVTQNNSVHNWGYDPTHHLALKGLYGTPESLKYLVDQAHLRGIAVLLDQVWNHIRSEGPLWSIQPDYDLNPYIKIWTDTNPNEVQESWGSQDLDHFNLKTIEYVNMVNKIFVDEYRIDGFRFDAGRYIGWDLQQPEIGLLAWTSALYQHDSDIISTVEYLPADPWLIDNTDISSAWHDSFHDLIKSDIYNQPITTTDLMRQVVGLHEYNNSSNSFSNRKQAIKFMLNHDEQSIIQEMVEFANYSLDEARYRDKFYSTILFTSLGIPLIFQGQEFGFKSGWLDENGNGNWDDEKLSYRPVDWNLLETGNGQEHLAHYKKLIKLRKSNPALYRGDFYDLYRYSNQKTIIYGYKDETLDGNDDQVVVIANFSNYDQTVTNVPFLSAGTWFDALGHGEDLYTQDGNFGEYQIPSKTAHVYTNNSYQLESEMNEVVVPNNVNIITCYPNPFNNSIIINIKALNGIIPKIAIYDLAGKEITAFEKINYFEQNLRVFWDGSDDTGLDVPTGVYFVRAEINERFQTKKILFLK